MELRHLRSFAVLAEERHFGRAAARLHIAQPALSQQIKQLERELGVSLFTRSTRRVEPTEAGLRFAEHARAVLGDVARAEADMELLASGHAGRVSVGFIGTATYDVLPRVAREVRRELPDIELELHGELLSPQLVTGLADHTFDVALIRSTQLRPDPLNSRDLTVRQLRTEPLVAVLPAHHPLAGRRRISLSALADEAFVMHPSGHRSSMHEEVLRACASAGFEPTVVTEVGETATLVVFVAAGLGVALVPAPVRSLGLDGVAYVSLSDPPSVNLALATRADDHSPAVRRVAELVRGCL
jgi:DNA-binding transcriptional LysR family regulator